MPILPFSHFFHVQLLCVCVCNKFRSVRIYLRKILLPFYEFTLACIPFHRFAWFIVYKHTLTHMHEQARERARALDVIVIISETECNEQKSLPPVAVAFMKLCIYVFSMHISTSLYPSRMEKIAFALEFFNRYPTIQSNSDWMLRKSHFTGTLEIYFNGFVMKQMERLHKVSSAQSIFENGTKATGFGWGNRTRSGIYSWMASKLLQYATPLGL